MDYKLDSFGRASLFGKSMLASCWVQLHIYCTEIMVVQCFSHLIWGVRGVIISELNLTASLARCNFTHCSISSTKLQNVIHFFWEFIIEPHSPKQLIFVLTGWTSHAFMSTLQTYFFSGCQDKTTDHPPTIFNNKTIQANMSHSPLQYPVYGCNTQCYRSLKKLEQRYLHRLIAVILTPLENNFMRIWSFI